MRFSAIMMVLICCLSFVSCTSSDVPRSSSAPPETTTEGFSAAQPPETQQPYPSPSTENLTANSRFVLDEWVTSPVPTAESEEVHNLDLHGEDFMVSNANNKIAVSDCPARSYCVLEVDDGFGLLVGSEQGEWGGWVKYVPFYGEPYFVTYGNTSGIFELDGDIYCLWHGNVMIRGYKSGIKKLYLSEETWRSQDDFMELPEVPLAYLVDDGRVYIVTPTKLLLFENEKITVLAEDCFWQRLGPNSLVKIAESLYIGMRGGVAEYDLATGETRWWVRKA